MGFEEIPIIQIYLWGNLVGAMPGLINMPKSLVI